MVLSHLGNAGRHIKLSGRIKHRHEAAHHQVINLELGFGKLRFYSLQSRNNGKVVADLSVVKDAAIGLYPIFPQNRFGIRLVGLRPRQKLQRLLHGTDVILRKGSGIRTRIREHLVLFVEALRNRKRRLGRKTEFVVGFAL